MTRTPRPALAAPVLVLLLAWSPACRSDSDGEVELWNDLYERHCYDLERMAGDWRSGNETLGDLLANHTKLERAAEREGTPVDREGCWLAHVSLTRRNAWLQVVERRASRLADVAPEAAQEAAAALTDDLGRGETDAILRTCRCGAGNVGPLSDILAAFVEHAPVALEKLTDAASACRAAAP